MDSKFHEALKYTLTAFEVNSSYRLTSDRRHVNQSSECTVCTVGFLSPLSVKPINPFPNTAWFLRACSTSLLKTSLFVTSNFSFSHSVFYLFGDFSFIFIKFEIVVCKLFQFGRV